MLFAIRVFAYLSICASSYFQIANALPAKAAEINNSIGFNFSIIAGDISTSNITTTPRQSLSIPPRGEIPTSLQNPANKVFDPALLFQVVPTTGLIPFFNNNANGIYVPIGTPSRVFPGLTGVQEIHNTKPYSFSEYKRISD